MSLQVIEEGQSRHLNSCENDEHAKLMTEKMTLERTRTSKTSYQFKTNLSNQLISNQTSNIEYDNYGSLCIDKELEKTL